MVKISLALVVLISSRLVFAQMQPSAWGSTSLAISVQRYLYQSQQVHGGVASNLAIRYRADGVINEAQFLGQDGQFVKCDQTARMLICVPIDQATGKAAGKYEFYGEGFGFLK